MASILIALALSSCASTPPLVDGRIPEGEFAYLPPGGQAYFYADVGGSRPVLEKLSLRGLDMTRMRSFLARVDFVAGAMYPGAAPRRLLAHAWRRKGKVPGAAALFFSAGWKKTNSPVGGSYYHSASYGLSVSTRGSHAFVSDADPFAPGPFVTAPPDLDALSREALLLGWVDNAATPVNNFLSLAGAPVRIPMGRILFALHRSPASNTTGDPRYELLLRVETQNSNQARALATLLALVRTLAENPDTGLDEEYLETLRPLLANPPGHDGAALTLRVGPMDAGETALLFNRFAVYSQQTK